MSLAFALLLGLAPQTVSADEALRARLDVGMAAYVASLDEDQAESAFYDFDDDERFDLRLAPLGLEGLRIDEMTDAQWAALEGLLSGVLSPSGLEKMNTIRSLEREVADTENGFFGFLMDRIRLPGRYFLALFGEPGPGSPWGFRFDGHHLSMNVTSIPNAKLSATPLFFGGQPRVVPADLPRAGLRVLADEEELAVAFLNGLTKAERAVAALPWIEGSAINRPMSISEDVDLVLPAPSGLRRSDLDDASRERFDSLVDVLLGNYQTAIADELRSGLRGNHGPVTFVYAAAVDGDAEAAGEAPVESGKALYYRIQGGGLSIEFDDTAVAADHIHLVYRHPEGDFGRDLLAEHLAESDHSK